MTVALAPVLARRSDGSSARMKLLLIEAARPARLAGPEGRVYRVALIEVGTSLNRRRYGREVLKKSAPLFENAPAYQFEFKTKDGKLVDHLPEEVEKAVKQGFLANRVGFFRNVRFEEYVDNDGQRQEGLTADFVVTDDSVRKKLLNEYEAGKKDLLGFSINAEGSASPIITEDGEAAVEVREISNVKSVDLVSTPAAGGQIQRLVASVTALRMERGTTMKDLIFGILARAFSDLVGTTLVESSSDQQVVGWLIEASKREGIYQSDLKEALDKLRTKDMQGAWDILADVAKLTEAAKKEGSKPKDEDGDEDFEELYSEMKRQMESAVVTQEAFKGRFGVTKEAARRMSRDLESMDEGLFSKKYGMGKKEARGAMRAKEGVREGLVRAGVREAVADQWETLGIAALRPKLPRDPGDLSVQTGPNHNQGNDPSGAGRTSQPTQPSGMPQVGLEPNMDLSSYKAVESALASLARERAGFQKEMADFASTRNALVLDKMLQESGLPEIAQARVKESLQSVQSLRESAVKTRIDAERRYLAALSPSGQVKGMGGFSRDADTHIQLGADRTKLLEAAMDGLMHNVESSCTCRRWNKVGQDIIPCNQHEQVPSFTGLHEAWYQIKQRPFEDGHEVLFESAKWVPTRAQKWALDGNLRESLNASSWTKILGDSITRRLIAAYNLGGLADWRKLVSEITPVKDFRTNRRMRLGGYGTIPDVAEAATYQNLVSPADEEATYFISKRGGLERLTLEMVANDDVGAIRRIPLSLGRAAAQTIYRFVFDLLVTNALVYDGVALAAAGHGNLDNVALSSAALTTAKRKMMAQTAFGNSKEFLGEANLPKYLVVPLDLEELAFILTTAPMQVGTAAADRFSTNPNLHSRYGLEYITVPYWGVEVPGANDNWGLVANPRSVPTIEMGFFNGAQDPELFVQDAPNLGAVFTADSVTYKIRHIYGGVVLDFRGFYLSTP